jgi:plastocyanin
MRFDRHISVVVLCSLAACGGSAGDGGGGTTNPPPPAAVGSVSLSRSTALLKPSETATITATPKDANGSSLSGRTVSWSVLPATGVANITPSGSSVTVTATANGTATVTATVEQKTADAHITVTGTFATSADVSVGPNGQNQFDPATVDIGAGGTVNFNWNGVTHNVTWASPPAGVTNISDRSSGTASLTFNQAGTYDYHCTIHAGMNGTVVVH